MHAVNEIHTSDMHDASTGVYPSLFRMFKPCYVHASVENLVLALGRHTSGIRHESSTCAIMPTCIDVSWCMLPWRI
jgi:hypothetical protein